MSSTTKADESLSLMLGRRGGVESLEESESEGSRSRRDGRFGGSLGMQKSSVGGGFGNWVSAGTMEFQISFCGAVWLFGKIDRV